MPGLLLKHGQAVFFRLPVDCRSADTKLFGGLLYFAFTFKQGLAQGFLFKLFDPAGQIISLLKTLKMSGALKTLDNRFLEARTNKLSYSEFLTAILLDEIEIRAQKKLDRLLARSRMGIQKNLESFDFSFNPSINAAQIKEPAICNFLDKGENIFFSDKPVPAIIASFVLWKDFKKTRRK